ncbi:SDR family NAD(P)-dependent oxidoreductase [Saccharothrix coeruleofusca]|uniref:Short-chain dehydrogenase/reductase n=1 Tax=Saccharothrix coeruleofusca TaxID=33919 RepID=A0A918ATS7_9PSEU|nr:SDR family NAD(P)-dependent oxidoreductase [Saccharothrix coeruleofusca]MBP2334833.1 NAD(P)-dependent dehydrogenase (short-subunit alcohol dehydrogenase family) [Saccharothrix coeruleofusca]GGP73865.1 short-chain dehydrogenase/reductase [Saccharothrix coeruleofusca]
MSVVLITGAATGIGNHTAKALAVDGHTVYASMRDPWGRDAEHAEEAIAFAEREYVDLRVIALDVTSQESADKAVQAILDATGRLDVVVHNAGHLAIGYVEAFPVEDVGHLIDINALGAHRVNRAALPHMREMRSGVLLYVGSTIGVTTPPFLGPYVVAKAAFDALAVVTSYETHPFGIETSIVMPGVIVRGTQHFPDAAQATDHEVTAAYAELDPLVARNEEATMGLFPPGVVSGPEGVAREISRVLALPFGHKPFRTVVDDTESGVDKVNETAQLAREDFVTRMGYSELLVPAQH